MNKPFIAILLVGLLIGGGFLGFFIGQASISTTEQSRMLQLEQCGGATNVNALNTGMALIFSISIIHRHEKS